mmetsp:Transcript_48577/g.118315  ORF Transcript_48577/g.118315 Transcript_48577/m.118315 type:complete len:375 (+) Transcript_48577:137-1261(+)|eukprot:CAMPEP_0206220460 /NCGR_PEP_ID=MMETSP0047_2-20121206/4889_1 /ASSEMBLY_ACC=CAM_ASM_000192 /TAXON_ID=195065 /ORGANISM="Chroomonas mesostigmatica_cf, Strain CCMP1168" /LENGTH=374 /DNA_ID=CAMNT_0053643121 /DNA_START=63 /DNA_END=1187 /DNA_ORIENTATION=+
MRRGLLLFVLFALLVGASGVQGEWDDDDDIDMDELLDTLRRTRGRPTPPPPSANSKDSLAALREAMHKAEQDKAAASSQSLREPMGGAVKAPRARAEKSSKKSTAKFRKDSADLDSVRTREEYQRFQAERVSAAFRSGKRQEVLLRATTRLAEPSQWDVPCMSEFYDSAYGVVKGCTPSVVKCTRMVRDGVASETEARDLVRITEKAMQNLFHQGGTTSLAPASSLDRLGPKGALLFQYFLNKVKLQLMYDYDLGEIYDSGALLTRLKANPPQDEWDMDPGHAYWNPHVDKANIPTYDYSALLYLNTFGEDFEGGDFAFIDDDADRVVQPRAGRLLLFPSGPENLHQVREVTKGTRYVLAMWFTCSKQHQYTDD